MIGRGKLPTELGAQAKGVGEGAVDDSRRFEAVAGSGVIMFRNGAHHNGGRRLGRAPQQPSVMEYEEDTSVQQEDCTAQAGDSHFRKVVTKDRHLRRNKDT